MSEQHNEMLSLKNWWKLESTSVTCTAWYSCIYSLNFACYRFSLFFERIFNFCLLLKVLTYCWSSSCLCEKDYSIACKIKPFYSGQNLQLRTLCQTSETKVFLACLVVSFYSVFTTVKDNLNLLFSFSGACIWVWLPYIFLKIDVDSLVEL